MSSAKKTAETVAGAILRLLGADPKTVDAEGVAAIIQQALAEASQAQEKKDLQRIADVQASAHIHLTRLLNASPAVIYCREAHGDYKPTFVSDSVTRLFGCTPARISRQPVSVAGSCAPGRRRTASMTGSTACSRATGARSSIASAAHDGTYFWVHDRQQIVRDDEGQADRDRRLVDRHHRAQGGRGGAGDGARAAATCCSAPRPSWSTASRQAAISPRPSSATASSCCSAIIPTNI